MIERRLQGNKLSLNVVKVQPAVIGYSPIIKIISENTVNYPTFVIDAEIVAVLTMSITTLTSAPSEVTKSNLFKPRWPAH